jgi:DNA polymerase-4
VEGAHQITLFEDPQILNLYQAMDNIRKQFGDRAIMKASGMDAKSISRWNPFNGEPPPLLANRRR